MKALHSKTVASPTASPTAGGGASDPRIAGDQRPCLQIQMDLSAMLDGELDAASIRRVMIHSDVCGGCRAFMAGIRAQLRVHKDFAAPLIAGSRSTAAQKLTRQLCDNRKQLAKIFYELGRGFVLMGVSPDFTRIVEHEPVPIPDVFMRGRNLLDEVQRSVPQNGAQGDKHQLGLEWVRAHSLFQSGHLGTPSQNLDKGKKLLGESLMLRPDYHEARIYLGHAHQVAGELDQARREFGLVLEQSADLVMRAFALVHLGNLYLEEGQEAHSIPYFLELVESELGRQHELVFAAIFNLALAYGRIDQLAECHRWFARLHADFPHKRRMVGAELKSRTLLAAAIERQPAAMKDFETSFPSWFPIQAK